MKFFSCPGMLAVAVFAVCVFACEKNTPAPAVHDDRPADIPESVESELVSVIGRGWDSLADTLSFFTRDLLLKGKTEGIGSDGVYYALKSSRECDVLSLSFIVQDSLFLYLQASDCLARVELEACRTTLMYESLQDSTRLTIDNVSATIPDCRPLSDDTVIPVTYKGEPVGYVSYVLLENTDYTVSRYPVMFYYGDVRSFGFYESIHFLTLIDRCNEFIRAVQ